IEPHRLAGAAPPRPRPPARPTAQAQPLDVVAIPLTPAEVRPASALHTHPGTTEFDFTPRRPGNHVIRFTLYDHVSGTALQQVETELNVTETAPDHHVAGTAPRRARPLDRRQPVNRRP
ncbi:hypothetical protein ACFU8I_18410, partial [Streptomyces sp. NPDC057540]|uniref:hypothetical protein n=1 Tax=Streptomyces sp. NPDC057540 TaxID=3346160 RepID=UPI00369BF7E1